MFDCALVGTELRTYSFERASLIGYNRRDCQMHGRFQTTQLSVA